MRPTNPVLIEIVKLDSGAAHLLFDGVYGRSYPSWDAAERAKARMDEAQAQGFRLQVRALSLLESVTCSCGRAHFIVPAGAIWNDESCLVADRIEWNCDCGSTIGARTRKIRQARAMPVEMVA